MATQLSLASRLCGLMLLCWLIPSLAHARTCSTSADWNPHGYIGEKWQAFNGPNSSLGCPRGPEDKYTPGLAATGLTYANGARQQDFEHGSIVWFPALGQKMLFSVWWNSADKVHVEFTGLDKARPHFRVGLSDGIHEQTVDFPSGTGHNRDLDVPYKNGVIVRLLPCEGTESSFTCAPHGKTVAGLFKEDAADGAIVPIISMQNFQEVGSYANNDSHVPPPAATTQSSRNDLISAVNASAGGDSSGGGAKLVSIGIRFLTTDDDLDNDTNLTVNFTCSGNVIANVSNPAVGWKALDKTLPKTGQLVTGGFDNGTVFPYTGGWFPLPLSSGAPLPLKANINDCTTKLRVDPNGRDHWVFNYNVLLTFSDATTIQRDFNGHWLDQYTRENTYSLKPNSN